MDEKKSSTAATREKNKYRDKTYDRMEIVVPKGYKEKIENLVTLGKATSRNDYIFTAILEKMARDDEK